MRKDGKRLIESGIQTPGLEGQVDARASVEPNLLGGHLRFHYRNRLGQRLFFKFRATLSEDNQRFDASVEGAKDTLLSEGRMWVHLGQTETGEKGYKTAAAAIYAPNGLSGSVQVLQECHGDAPWNKSHPSELVTLPLT